MWPQYWDLTNLGDLQRDLMGVKSHSTPKKKTCEEQGEIKYAIATQNRMGKNDVTSN
jgi:hypothetical protein